MVNYDKQLMTLLQSAFGSGKVFYENFIDKRLADENWFITYLPINNSSLIEGDTIKISRLTYRLKIWCDSAHYADCKDTYLPLLETTMKDFTRTAYNELWVDEWCQLIFTYECKGWEILEVN